jgi:hypothetical protein
MTEGARPLEIMEPYMVQLVNRMAIHYTFDLPSSPFYRQKFELSMLQHVQRYQYATVEMCWWIWTAMASQWVDDKNTNVIAAVRRLACSKWIDEFTAYGNYEVDLANEIPWRLRRNLNYNPDRDPKGDEVLVDLNYITLTGTLEKIAHDIADFTNPRLDWTDIVGALKQLQDTPVTMPEGGYKPQPRETLFKWHKYTKLPEWDAQGNLLVTGTKHVDAQVLHPQYRLDDDDNGTTIRDERHMPKFGPNAVAHVVDMSDLYSEKKLHIMPHVDNCFRNSLIIKALISATMCGSFPEGKMLLGFSDESDPMQMQVYECDAQKKERFMRIFDEEYGWHYDRSSNTFARTIPPEKDVPEEYWTPSRRTGLTFPRRGAIDQNDSVILNSVPSVPCTEEDRDRRVARVAAEISQMNLLVETFADLDVQSATARHMACGRPLDEPVRTPAWIRKQYQEACKAQGRAVHAGINYPADWRVMLNYKKNKWESARPTKRDVAVLDHDDAHELSMTNLSMSEADELQRSRKQARPQGSISRSSVSILNKSISLDVPIAPPPPPSGPPAPKEKRTKKAQLEKKRPRRPVAVPLYQRE